MPLKQSGSQTMGLPPSPSSTLTLQPSRALPATAGHTRAVQSLSKPSSLGGLSTPSSARTIAASAFKQSQRRGGGSGSGAELLPDEQGVNVALPETTPLTFRKRPLPSSPYPQRSQQPGSGSPPTQARGRSPARSRGESPPTHARIQSSPSQATDVKPLPREPPKPSEKEQYQQRQDAMLAEAPPTLNAATAAVTPSDGDGKPKSAVGVPDEPLHTPGSSPLNGDDDEDDDQFDYISAYVNSLAPGADRDSMFGGAPEMDKNNRF